MSMELAQDLSFDPDDLMEPEGVLQHFFGFSSFRTHQDEAVHAVMAGQDTVVILPTGGGKSLCFQVPALTLRCQGHGPTIVISPLIALMEDQVEALRGRGVEAEAVHSQQSDAANRDALDRFRMGELDLIYVSPERAVLDGFQKAAEAAQPALLAIDEAHCISQWGHDFRPEYSQIDRLRERLEVPTIALTATATPRVIEEMVRHLHLDEPVIIRGDFRRPNLSFSVQPLRTDSARLEMAVEMLAERGFRTRSAGRAIIYCATRKKVEMFYEHLKGQGFPVGYYHAGRKEADRAAAHKAYETNRTPILVATNAFGMGIDNPDVRLIVHGQTPGSLEAYYQEAGRAGRDGAPADCVLFFGIQDLVTQRRLSSGSRSKSLAERKEASLKAMEEYARAEFCRQSVITEYFTGKFLDEPCGTCDVCTDSESTLAKMGAYDETSSSRKAAEPVVALASADKALIVQAAGQLTRPVGKGSFAKALRGSRAKTLRRGGLLKINEHGSLKHYNESSVVEAIEELLNEGSLERKGRKYPTVWLAGRPVRSKKAEGADEPKGFGRSRRRASSTLGRALDNYRKRRARGLGWKTYMVFQRKVIEAIERERPTTLQELEQIPGLGPAKVSRFGDELLELIERHR